MLRYALLWHECPPGYRDGPHYDLLVERPGADGEHRLAAWSLLELPQPWAIALGRAPAGAREVAATALADHRAAYLDYEGPVSGGRGTVERVAGGRVEWLHEGEAQVRLRLSEPSRIAGEAVLSAGVGDRWRLTVSVDSIG
ncbi:hypothetical protein [Botrimarina sp.]|uniref:hypothetical protein n=1 Tax=Botrimarina sp. TaxID=2795802 RepID=UPI0032ED0432